MYSTSHREHAGCVVEFFADVFPDTLQGAAAARGCADGGLVLMANLHAGQPGRQPGAFGLVGLGRCPGRGRQLRQLDLDGGHVGVQRFIEQAELRGIELFAAPAKFPALEDRHLVRELLDFGLAVFELAVLALQLLAFAGNDLAVLLALVRDPAHQLTGQHAQLLGVQAVQLLCIKHGQQFAQPFIAYSFKRFNSTEGQNSRESKPA